MLQHPINVYIPRRFCKNCKNQASIEYITIQQFYSGFAKLGISQKFPGLAGKGIPFTAEGSRVLCLLQEQWVILYLAQKIPKVPLQGHIRSNSCSAEEFFQLGELPASHAESLSIHISWVLTGGGGWAIWHFDEVAAFESSTPPLIRTPVTNTSWCIGLPSWILMGSFLSSVVGVLSGVSRH